MKILLGGNTLSLSQLMAQYDVQNQGGISINSGTEFERTLNQKIWSLGNELRDMLPEKPILPNEPSRTTKEWIPFEGLSSIWIDDNRPESEQYRDIEKSNDEYQNELSEYQQKLSLYQQLSKDYEQKMNLIQNDQLFLNKRLEYQALQTVQDVYNSSTKIPEWHEVKTKLEQAINTSETTRGGKDRLLEKIQEIDSSNQSPERKVEQMIDLMLQEYRHILRGGLTGMFSKETGSGLAEKLQTFSRETLGIELPRSLEKGAPLSIESLHRSGRVRDDLYQGMTNKSPGDKYEVQQGFNIGLGYGNDNDL
ncbi:hypothetical protein [Legionella sp. WA2022007384]